MGQTKSNRKKEQTKKNTVEVLYQKMGDRWFAFSLIEDEVFIGSIAQDELDTTIPEHILNRNTRELG